MARIMELEEVPYTIQKVEERIKFYRDWLENLEKQPKLERQQTTTRNLLRFWETYKNKYY